MSPVADKLLGELDYLQTFLVANAQNVWPSWSGPDTGRKYSGLILITNNKVIVNSGPIFNSKDEAISAMEEIISQAKEFANGELRIAGAPLLSS